eukprot:910026-Amphidinium_carterae.1
MSEKHNQYLESMVSPISASEQSLLREKILFTKSAMWRVTTQGANVRNVGFRVEWRLGDASLLKWGCVSLSLVFPQRVFLDQGASCSKKQDNNIAQKQQT